MDQAIRRGVSGIGIAIVLALGLAGCSTVGVDDLNPGALVSGGRDVEKEQEALRRYAVVEVCPEVQVRDGTQMLRRYERGKDGDASALTFQGTIGRYARECRPDPAGGGTVIKVGMAGRLISGPTGATGTVDLPLRVVLVKNGSEVAYSQLHSVSATIQPGTASVGWTQVVDGIVVPPQTVPAQYLIYIGFDEGGR